LKQGKVDISEWKGTGLFSENMHRILIQLTDYEKPAVLNATLQSRLKDHFFLIVIDLIPHPFTQ